MKVCVGVCGSIAAYRSVDFVRELAARGHEVRCVLTRSAREFVSPRVLETFLGQAIQSENIFDPSHSSTDHISAARWAEAFVIYGATAQFLARMAHGFGDDFLSLQLLAFEGPVLVAPAMNPAMWKNPAVAENVQTLRKRGFYFAGPVAGTVACGETGVGHLAPHIEIFSALETLKATKEETIEHLRRKKILISAGPMRTDIDPVRYTQNRSSGKMGLEIARACQRAGAASVTVLLGPVSPEMQHLFSCEFKVRSYSHPADYEASLEELFPLCDVFFSAAAVLDFEFLSASQKIERKTLSQSTSLNLPLRAVPDIVAKFAAQKKAGQRVIAFAAETGSESEIIARATQKMLKKGADAMIANPVWPGLGPDAARNQVWVLRPQHSPVALGPAPKEDLARPILENLAPEAKL